MLPNGRFAYLTICSLHTAKTLYGIRSLVAVSVTTRYFMVANAYPANLATLCSLPDIMYCVLTWLCNMMALLYLVCVISGRAPWEACNAA